MTWLSWDHEPWQEDLRAHVAALTRLRRENAALRPSRYARRDVHTPNASVMDWYNQNGDTMDEKHWTDPESRTLQYVAESTPVDEPINRILLIVHGLESATEVTLPATLEGVTKYVSLWSSADEKPSDELAEFAPGDVVVTPGTSMRLFRVE
jgi:glycogen operon protein